SSLQGLVPKIYLMRSADIQNSVHIQRFILRSISNLRQLCFRLHIFIFSSYFKFIKLYMNKSRLEAFSDGVIAIIITIMVLGIEVPDQVDWRGIISLWPQFLSYVLSFIYVGIYWNNHHHTFQAEKRGV